jgi:exodeoxyribonuclease VII large subunit
MSSPFDLPFDDPSAEAPGPELENGSATRGQRGTPAPARRSSRRVLTVSELTARIRTVLEEGFFEVWVEGELSSCRVWNTGHLYFTLKDPAAQIRGVMFRSALRALRFAPKDGLRVVARGRLSVYDPKGEYQLVCEHLEPEGLGARQLAFEQLKERLATEGLFAAARKRPLPALPRKIGVVTSLDGAAVRDIVQILRRRYVNVHIVIRPTRVQGEDASLDIARGVRAVSSVPGVDVVIVGRGGGASEDLWAFNSEVVARAIAGCRVPTISAVGHETDVTIADFVADLRAPTPSAAAELVVARKDELVNGIERLERRLRASLATRLHRAESRLRSLEARPGLAGMSGRLAGRARHADELTDELHGAVRSLLARRLRAHRVQRALLDAFDPRRRLAEIRNRLMAADGRMRTTLERRRHAADARLRSAAGRLESLSPLGVLARGYAVCWNEARTALVRDAASVAPGDRVHVRLHRGELACDVRDTTGNGT